VQINYARAVKLYEHNRRAEAEVLCRQIIDLDPSHFEALNLLGLLELRMGHSEAAMGLMERAIQVNPQFAATHSNMGLVLLQRGCFAEALASCDRALSLESCRPEVLRIRGQALSALSRHAEAVVDFDRSLNLDANSTMTLLWRGIASAVLKRWQEALASFDRALRIDENVVEAHFNRSVALREMGRFAEGLESCNKALTLRPDYAEAHWNRAALLHTLKRPEEALENCNTAVRLNPNDAEAQLNRGIVLQHLNRPEEALECIDRALALSPDLAKAHLNRGSVLHELDRLDEALLSYDRSITLDADLAEAHAGRGLVLSRLMQLDAALASFDAALALKPDLASAHLHRSLASLLNGDYESAWEDYEWRWKTEHGGLYDQRRDFQQPLWLGQKSIAGKTILLHSEQGLGDTIQFCRYAKMVAALGAKVILEVAEPLKCLLSTLDGVTLAVVRGETPPEFDYHCPLMSLPLAFETTLSSIPAQIPYIHSDAQKARLWAQRLGEKQNLRVGLVWSGGLQPNRPETWSVNARRNIPLARLACLRLHGIEFYSLQKGQPAESELADLKAKRWDGPEIMDYIHLQQNFDDTAALVENLDLVISVDTSTAHLAGALGKPVWLLNRFDSSWHWLCNRADSPWYPTVRIYRQKTAGDWDGVVQDVRADLMQLAARPQ
jgi:tetratricopeptide (TPR) repeat protein